MLLFCMRGCGCIKRPAFPAPSYFSGRTAHAQLRRTAPRDRGRAWSWLFEKLDQGKLHSGAPKSGAVLISPAFAKLRLDVLHCNARGLRRENNAATLRQNERTFVPTLLRCVGKLASHPRSGVHEQAGRNSQTGIHLPGTGFTGFRTQEFLAGKSRRVGTARA